ncbi:unnamed protein product [Clavelina lepadiformis]|uniref:Tetratricopeptide repeat protein n=1 Tax=Clavelina lepadiformis TaxID=159417 RepID=A0ABP0GA13_CLALP
MASAEGKSAAGKMEDSSSSTVENLKNEIGVRIDFIKKKLQSNDFENAEEAIKEIALIKIGGPKWDCSQTIQDLLQISSVFLKRCSYMLSLCLVMSSTELSDLLPDNEERMEKLGSCSAAAMDVSTTMVANREKNAIEKQALPILKEVCRRLQALKENIDIEHKAYLLSYCYHRIATSCYYIGEFKEALEYGEAGISVLSKTFGEDAKKYIPTAACYYLNGRVYHYMGKYDQAVECFKKTIEVYEVDDSFGEEEKAQNIRLVQEKLLRAEASLPPA